MSSLALIQLISEQTVQNLLPLLALKPSFLIHLVTPKTMPQSEHLGRATKALGIAPSCETIRLTIMPSIQEVYLVVCQKVEQFRKHGMEVVVNFTGGTKLMSIGAYRAATDMKALSLYVDTERRQLVSGGTGDGHAGNVYFENGILPLDPFIRQLRVDILAISNGCERITSSQDWHPYVPLAAYLLEQDAHEQMCWEAVRSPIKEPMSLPGPVGLFLLKLGLVQRTAGGFLLRRVTAQGRTITDERSRELVIRLLAGGWWEVAVLASAEKSGRFRDLRWSVKVGEKDATTDMEEDVVGLDGPDLLYISCKRGRGLKQKLGPLLDELRSRAERVGGRFAKKYLAIYRDWEMPPERLHDLRHRASSMGIRIIGRQDVISGKAWKT